MSYREPFTEKSESDSSIKLNTQTRRQVPFYGTLEKTQMASQKENQNTLNRKAAVRQQENELARQKIEEAKKKQQKNNEQEKKNQDLEAYARLRKEAEELLKAKALAEEEAGKAHRAAEQSRLEKEEKDRQRREANQRASGAAKKRSNAASAAFKEEDEALNGAERKRLENLNKLRDKDQEYGRKLGADYREELKNRPEEEVEDYDAYKDYEKNISRKLLRTGPSDFTKSRVHNAIVVSHQDEVGQPSGFEAAEVENKKTETRKLEFTATRDDQRQRSLDRFQKAHEKEKDKKQVENFNKEMERLQKANNIIKVDQGKQNPEMQTKPATKFNNNARIQKESEKAFEDVFMKPDRRGVSEGNISTEKELPPKSSFASKKKSTLKNGSGKSYNFESERSPQSGYGSGTQRTNEDGTLTQTIREEDNYDSQEKVDANVFKSDALTNTVSGGAQYSGYEESYENERPPERKYPQNLHESTSSVSSNPYAAQQERKQQAEKPWKKNVRNKSQDLASKEPEVEVFVQNKKPEPQRNVYQEEGSPERSLEYSNQSSPSKEETKSYGAVSFGEKKPTSEWNTGHLETANLKPESLQRPFDYSYQQQQQQPGKGKVNAAPPKEDNGDEPSSYFNSYVARKQGVDKSKASKEESRVEEKSQKDEVQEQIRGYIQEQEAFLKKYDNEKKKLSEKIKAPQASAAASNPAAESMSRSNQRQERQERQQAPRQKLLAQENDPEEEAINELQKKTNALLSRFMAPAGRRDSDSEDERAPESEEEEESESEMQSSQKYGQSIGQRFKQSNNFTESQSSVGFRREPRQEETPERNPRFNPRQQGFSSPSDLDYSVSDRDRSEKKSLAETMDYPKDSQNEYTQSFGQRRFNATETFGKRGDSGEKPQKINKGKTEQQKGWKMEFNFDGKEDQGREQGREQAATEERRSEQTRKSEQVVIEDEGGKEPNLAELFQRKKKKMMEKYEHQREQEPQREEAKESKPSRTKEEILKQRKAMMQYKGPQNPKAATQGAPSNNNDERGRRQFVNPFTGEKGSGKEPNPELLDRLAFGKKATVNKKDMHALTSKNYQMLPEVKKKKELEQKKEDMKRRQENVKKLEQERRTNSKSRK